MFKILDRYVIREVLPPFFLWLLVITFVLEMPPILDYAEKLIEKGFEWSIILRVLALLLPQALGVTIPISLLLGLLIGLGRLSGDREFVALQSCGISLYRFLRPIALLAVLACAATGYVMIVALPNANQSFREIMFGVLSRAEGDVKPRVFFENFQSRVLYVRDVLPAGGWSDVFMADSSRSEQTTVYLARQGRLVADRERRTVELLLEDGTRHTTFASRPEEYEGSSFERLVLALDPDVVFPKPTTILKGDNEKSIAELRATIAELNKIGSPAYSQFFTIQLKFVIPLACLVFALIGLGLGFTNRKEGKLAGFVVGFGVVMVYYFLLWGPPRALANTGRISPSFAPWIANIVLGACGVALVWWRARSADQPFRISIPTFGFGSRPPEEARDATPYRRIALAIKVPHVALPRPRLLDLYVTRQYLRVFALGVVGLLGLFYISSFMDLADKLFRGSATTGMLLRYLYFATPDFVYYVIPMAALVAALVVIGLLTRNSELIVMRACGVSLYRSALPLLMFAVLLSAVLFELQEHVLAKSHRRAEAIKHVMRGFPAQTFDTLDRRWIVGQDGDIYHYESFDPRLDRFSRLTVFDMDPAGRLASLTYATEVVPAPQPVAADGVFVWHARDGWTREFATGSPRDGQSVVGYSQFSTRPMPLEVPDYFKTDTPDADSMTYAQLKRYIGQLQSGGFHAVPYMVRLQRKVAFPFVTLIMTLLAIPFAVTIGRSGAMYGIGVAVVLGIGYWIMLSVFGAIGSGGLIPPVLAAWAPNILFGAAAAYMVLTVRT